MKTFGEQRLPADFVSQDKLLTPVVDRQRLTSRLSDGFKSLLLPISPGSLAKHSVKAKPEPLIQELATIRSETQRLDVVSYY